MAETPKDIEAYLARIRKTIEESKSLVSQAELRIAETDRMLEKQGLTREQVMAMRFSEAQMEAVNEELKRRGMDPLEKWEADSRPELPDGPHGVRRESEDASRTPRVMSDGPATSDELAYRQSKFGMMMKPFHI